MRRWRDRNRPREERDLEVGKALDELETPEYPPDFMTTVWARVDGAKDATRATAPEPSAPEADEAATGGGRLRSPRRSPSLWRRHPVLAAAAAAGIAAAIAAAALVGLPGVSRISGPQQVSAAQVIHRALQALSAAKTLQADTTDRWATAELPGGVWEYTLTHGRLLARSDGSSRWTQTDGPQTGTPLRLRTRDDARDTAYDAAHGVFRDYYRGWDWDVGQNGRYENRFIVTTGYPLGEPDTSDAGGGTGISAVARALQAGGKASLETTVYEGRPVWVISISTGVATGLQMTEEETALITIDQQTSLPVRFRIAVDGAIMLDNRWSNVRVDEPLPDAAFIIAPPKGARVVHEDRGFRRLALSHIGSKVDYVPLLPAWLPAGYTQKWAAFSARWRTEYGETIGRGVLAAQYVRGFDVLTVTTRRVLAPQWGTMDPIDDPTWADLVRKDVRLTAGAFAGATAHVVVAPRSRIPHLYAVKGDLLLTIAGGATAEDLVSVAESLRPYRPE